MTGEELVALARSTAPLVEFFGPATESALTDAEAHLGVRLPQELRAFLLRSDGAMIGVRLSSGKVLERASPFVWSLAEIEAENHEFPRPNAGLEAVLFFASAGVDGILFGHRLTADVLEDQVVVWHPIEETLDLFAPSFGRYVERWPTGELKV